jgi:hypothetical protein
MFTLIAAALAAAQPAPPADHGQMAPMNHAQHDAAKEKCCCDDMAKGGDDMDSRHDGHGADHADHGASK